MPHTQTPASPGHSEPAPPRPASLRQLLQHLAPGVAVNALGPALVYHVLSTHGVTQLPALLGASLVPAGDVAWSWLRTRRVHLISVIALGTIAIGLVLGLVAKSSFLVLARDSLIVGLAGGACWGSLLLPRPLTFVLGRAFATRHAPAPAEGYDRRWHDPAFRRRQRMVTFVWGLALLALAVLRTLLALAVPAGAFLVLAPGLTLLVVGGLGLWTWRSGARHTTAPLPR